MELQGIVFLRPQIGIVSFYFVFCVLAFHWLDEYNRNRNWYFIGVKKSDMPNNEGKAVILGYLLKQRVEL